MKLQISGQVLQTEGTAWGKVLRQEKPQPVPRLEGDRSSQSAGREGAGQGREDLSPGPQSLLWTILGTRPY